MQLFRGRKPITRPRTRSSDADYTHLGGLRYITHDTDRKLAAGANPPSG